MKSRKRLRVKIICCKVRLVDKRSLTTFCDEAVCCNFIRNVSRDQNQASSAKWVITEKTKQPEPDSGHMTRFL